MVIILKFVTDSFKMRLIVIGLSNWPIVDCPIIW